MVYQFCKNRGSKHSSFAGRSDGAAEAFHAGGDGEGADGAKPVQGALHGAAGGGQVSVKLSLVKLYCVIPKRGK